jgi:hypothetical protein
MGIIDLASHTIFRCDRCRRWHIERYGPSWDERRLAFMRRVPWAGESSMWVARARGFTA